MKTCFITLFIYHFETWQTATLPHKINDLSLELGYSGKSKGKEDIFQRLMDKGAEFEIGQRKFKLENLYYTKQDLEKGKFKEENISKTQINLIYFFEYLLMDKGAEFEIGQRKFKLENLYYTKQDLEKGKFKEENISKTQINLIYFFEYLRDVLEAKIK